MKKEIIFLHGWERSKHDWDRIISMFGDEYICTAIDFPGFGENKSFDRSWGVAEYADWLKGEIKGKENIILVGHSFGGRVAGYLASAYLPNISGLVLFASPSIYRPNVEIKLKSGMARFLKSVLPVFLLDKLNTFKPVDLQNADKTGKRDIFKRVVTFDQTEFLKKINIPTLIIWGDRDAQTSYKIGEEMNKLIKDSKLQIVEGGTHDLHLENPTLFYGILRKYVDEH